MAVLLMAGLVWAAQGRTLQVTVNYAGSAEVSASNPVFLAVWDSPDFGGGTALPLAAETVQANGAVVTFENLAASPVYVTALYDEQGGWDGLSQPPSGTPAGAYSTDGFGTPAPVDVGGGQTVEIEFSFDDAFRMP